MKPVEFKEQAIVYAGNRPEYIQCIKFTAVANQKTWCNNKHSQFGEPFFQSIDHAALNGQQGGRLVVCPECLDAITKALNNGYHRS